MSVESRQLSLTCSFVAPDPALHKGPFSPGAGCGAGSSREGSIFACGLCTASPGASAGACPTSSSASVSASGSAWWPPEGDSGPTWWWCKCVRARVLNARRASCVWSEAAALTEALLQPPYDITAPAHQGSGSTVTTGTTAGSMHNCSPCCSSQPWRREAHSSRTFRGLGMAGIQAQWLGSRATGHGEHDLHAVSYTMLL